MPDSLKHVSYVFIVTSLLLIAIGLYYCIFEAGIPYQDPTPEMQAQYDMYAGTGDSLVVIGMVFLLIGAIMKILAFLYDRLP